MSKIGAGHRYPLFDVPVVVPHRLHRRACRPARTPRWSSTAWLAQADVWVNGTEVATAATVDGDYTSFTFDVTSLLRPGTNSLALEMYPNDPNTMFTLDDVDWNQIPPDNNTGIQFPVQLHVSDALAISNSYVTQDDAADLSSAALTVTPMSPTAPPARQTGDGRRRRSPPPGGGGPITVSQPVTVPASTQPDRDLHAGGFPALTITTRSSGGPTRWAASRCTRWPTLGAAGRRRAPTRPAEHVRHPLGHLLPDRRPTLSTRGRAGLRDQRRAVRLPGRRLRREPVPALLGGRPRPSRSR